MKIKHRNINSLKRKPPYRSPRESVLIVCEGEKTEPFYFEGISGKLGLQPMVEVVVEGRECGSAPINVVDHAIQCKKNRERKAAKSNVLTEYDKVWCVIDVEAPTPHPTLAEAQDKAKANNLKIALSNPCFEFWYLLHFRKTSALMQHNREVEKALKQEYPSYKKSDPDFFNIIYPKTETAIKNSKEVLNEKMCAEDLKNCNPSTHVHILVEDLQQISGKPAKKQSGQEVTS